MLADFHQWSNAEPYIGSSRPNYVSGLDSLRIGAYSLYEQIYWTVPTVFEIIARGSEDNPIYIPSGRQIVETMHRYLANGLKIVPDPTIGSDTERQAASLMLTNLVRRERLYSRFSSAKRYGIMQGDWAFHITADADRPDGSRVSITPVDPAMYFPIHNPLNVDEIIGAILGWVETIDDESVFHRITYRKQTEKGGPSPITVEEGIYDLDATGLPDTEDWEDASPIQVIRNPELLASPIDQIPIYHIQHFDQPGSPWGSSEIRGVERLMGAINQSITDEELALALEGLGVYYCDGGAPVDPDTGEEVPWDIGPGRVLEIPRGSKFGRVNGIGSIEPQQQHIKYMHDQLDFTTTIPAIAKGKVDVQAAESGIALLMELGPLLARVAEKEQVVTDVTMNMLFDLRRWLQAYERGTRLDNVIWIPTYGDKLPMNRRQRFEEIMAMLGAKPPLVTGAWARSELRKIGYEFPDEAQFAQQILNESRAAAQIDVDVLGNRIDNELNGRGDREPTSVE